MPEGKYSKFGNYQKILNISSRNVLMEAGIEKGQVIIEVGSGEGDLTVWLAEKVGCEGRVFAIDADSESCKRLRKKLIDREISNVLIINENALLCLDDLPKADIVTSRFVLLHNKDELFDLIAKMAEKLNKFGRLVLEEPIMNDCYDSHGLDFWNRAIGSYSKLCEIQKIDPNIGSELYEVLSSRGFYMVSSKKIQPLLNPLDANNYVLKALNSHKEEYIKYNVFDINSYEDTLIFYREFPIEKLTFCAFHSVTQLIGMKRYELE